MYVAACPGGKCQQKCDLLDCAPDIGQLKRTRLLRIVLWVVGIILLFALTNWIFKISGIPLQIRWNTSPSPIDPTVYPDNERAIKQPPIAATEVPKYKVFELTLKANRYYPNPYLLMPGNNTQRGFLTGTFRGPKGEALTMDGFWDGGDTWKIRMAPVSEGTWVYSTTSLDSGLHGHSGSFYCYPSDSKGFFRVHAAHPHHFMWDDGTPFYPAWTSFGVPHFHTHGGPRIDDGTFEAIADIRRGQGFNTIFWGFGGFNKPAFRNRKQKNEGGPPFIDFDTDRLNPSYHQFADLRLKALSDRGFVVQFHLGWPDQRIATEVGHERLKRYWRYLIARYAAFNIHYNIFGEIDEFGHNWEEIAKAYISITRNWDPYKHPVSTHMTRKPDAAAIKKLDLDFVILQKPTTVTNEYLGLNVPVVNAEYGGYEDYQISGERLRPLVWDVRMRGGYFVYETWGSDIESIGARNAKLTNLFFRSRTRFWLLEYHPELFEGKPGLADPGQEYVIYLPGWEIINVNLKDAAKPLNVEWYDPKTGNSLPAGKTQVGGYQRFGAPFRGDAVLHIGGLQDLPR